MGKCLLFGGDWIWEKQSPDNYITCTFYKEFEIPGIPITASLDIATDDEHKILMNDVNIGQDTIDPNFNHITIDVLSFVKTGVNTLKLFVRNELSVAGMLYRLSIESLIN